MFAMGKSPIFIANIKLFLMLNKTNQLNFSGENVYVGIDVHKKSWKVTIQMDELVYKTFTQNPQANLLESYLKRNFPMATYLCAYEAGFSGFWIQQELEKRGINCIVVNPADIPTTDKEKKFKNDKRDSRKIARALKNGELRAIFVPSVEELEHRHLVRTRASLVRERTRHKNKIKSILNFYGIEYPEQFKEENRHWSRRFFEWLKALDFDTEHGKNTLQVHIDNSLYFRDKILDITKKIRALSKTEKYERQSMLLCTIPGIGMLSAMTVLTELCDIRRFKDLNHLCSFIGLIPNTHSTGEKDRIGNITNRGNKSLKSVLIEASWVAIRNDPALLLKYKKLCLSMEANKAIIRIAKKMINRIRYVLLNNEPYEKGLIK
jgi:transposase